MSETRADRPTDVNWRQLEADARAEVLSTIAADDFLQPGRVVAWVLCRFGRTDGLSVVHRVGQPIAGVAATLCGEIIPPAIRLIPLNANLARTLGRCSYCERLNAKQEPNGVAA